MENNNSYDANLVLVCEERGDVAEPYSLLYTSESGKFSPINPHLVSALARQTWMKNNWHIKPAIDLAELRIQDELRKTENPKEIRDLLTQGRLRVSYLLGKWPFINPYVIYRTNLEISELIGLSYGSISTFGNGNLTGDTAVNILLANNQNRFLTIPSSLQFEFISQPTCTCSEKHDEIECDDEEDKNNDEAIGSCAEEINNELKELILSRIDERNMRCQIRAIMNDCLNAVKKTGEGKSVLFNSVESAQLGLATLTNELSGLFRKINQVEEDSYKNTPIAKYFDIADDNQMVINIPHLS